MNNEELSKLINEDLKIDISSLETEWENQALNYYKWSELLPRFGVGRCRCSQWMASCSKRQGDGRRQSQDSSSILSPLRIASGVSKDISRGFRMG